MNDDRITYAQLSRDETGPEDGEATPDSRQDISDPATGLSRLLSERRGTCILRPGDPMTRPDHPSRATALAGQEMSKTGNHLVERLGSREPLVDSAQQPALR